ncbi:hypothetical protein [Burkholderia perseverans]|uniref:hypothetical protein n=1 Tax=Burkholderia perseverans TaxID=2615214 RepID=UPI001FEFC742|nr:hypothetical protein [Burkholderia perseverans]
MNSGIANPRAATKTPRDARRGAAEHTAAPAALSTRRRAIDSRNGAESRRRRAIIAIPAHAGSLIS